MQARSFQAGRAPDKVIIQDMAFGGRIAKAISQLEVGQTVVVKDGTVLAVEGFEGTDKCLERGGQLAGKNGGATAVKVARKNHDMRFDIPCIGLTTIETCRRNGIHALAFEASMTLLLDKDEWIEHLRKWKFSLLSFVAVDENSGVD